MRRRVSPAWSTAGLLVLSAFICLFIFHGQASARQAVEARIVGIVTDESKAVLPGVTVTATSPALQVGQVIAVTDERGEYRLTPLPIGTYTLTYELPGFQTLKREGVRLTAGFTGRVDAAMSVGGVEETITVSGAAPVVDVSSTAATTTLTRETLDLVPTARTGYNAILAQAPGVRETLQNFSPTGGVNFRAFGQSFQSYQATDGVVTANPKAETQSGNYIDFTAFEEAVVSTMGHDASIPNRGVMINAVVKSGSNDFHGRAFAGYTNHRFQSNNITPELAERGVGTPDKLDLKDDWSGELGGRLIRDKVWFFASARAQRDRQLTQDCFQPNGEQCYSWQRAYYFTTKETWQINAGNRLTHMLMVPFRRDLEGADQFTAWERRTEQNNTFSPVWKGEYQAIRGNSLTMSAMYGIFVNHSGRWGEEFGGGRTAARDRITGFASGTAPNMGERNMEHRQNVRLGVNYYKPDWVGGDHSFKIGADFFEGQANRYRTLDRGGAPIYELVFANGVADFIEVNNTPVTPKAQVRYVGAYVHDTWDLGRRLTLNLGVRYARDNGVVPEQCRDAAVEPGHIANPAECFPKQQFPMYHSLAPRARFTWDITGKGRTLLKVGWGRYMKMRYTDELQTATRNVITTTVYTWRDLNGNREYDTGEVNLDVNGPDFQSRSFTGQGGALANGIVNPDETQPYTDEYMVQFERELLPGFGVRLTGIHSRALNWHRYENSLRPYETYTIPVTNPDRGPDDRLGTADDTGTTITYWEYPRALGGDAFQAPWIVNDPAANKKYNSFEIAASKQLRDRWQLQASFSASHVNDPLPNNVGGGINFAANTRDPNSEIFAEIDQWEWQGRVSGSYLLPWDLLVAANYLYRSGDTWARTAVFRGGRTIPSIRLRVEPQDANRLPSVNLVDVRVEKQLRFGTQRMSLRLNVFNLFNAATITGVQTASGPNFNRVTGILRSRLAEFNVAYDF